MNTNQPTPDREEIRMLYQVTVSDLSYFKSQQWSVANYTLLVLAALLGIEQLLKPPPYHIERWLLAVLAFGAACSGIYLLRKLEKSISVRRSRLDSVRDLLTKSFNFSWSAEDKGDEFLSVLHVLTVVLFIAGGLSFWLLLLRL
jgi:hypothetical protein